MPVYPSADTIAILREQAADSPLAKTMASIAAAIAAAPVNTQVRMAAALGKPSDALPSDVAAVAAAALAKLPDAAAHAARALIVSLPPATVTAFVRSFTKPAAATPFAYSNDWRVTGGKPRETFVDRGRTFTTEPKTPAEKIAARNRADAEGFRAASEAYLDKRDPRRHERRAALVEPVLNHFRGDPAVRLQFERGMVGRKPAAAAAA
jgi:hypothetical protein